MKLTKVTKIQFSNTIKYLETQTITMFTVSQFQTNFFKKLRVYDKVNIHLICHYFHVRPYLNSSINIKLPFFSKNSQKQPFADVIQNSCS